MASWLDDIFGAKPAPQVVSMYRNGGAPTPPGAGGTGGSPFDIQSLMSRFEAANNTANEDSLKQYKNLMMMTKGEQNRVIGPGGYYDQAADLQNGMGATQNAQINSAETKAKGQSEQDLISRGLGNTTVRSSVNRGIGADATSARNSVAEQVAMAKSGLLTQKAGADQQIGQLRADSLLSRSNTAPNAQMYAQLIQQLMANGGGGGAGNFR